MRVKVDTCVLSPRSFHELLQWHPIPGGFYAKNVLQSAVQSTARLMRSCPNFANNLSCSRLEGGMIVEFSGLHNVIKVNRRRFQRKLYLPVSNG